MEILEVLKSVVADPATPSTEKNRAATILAYIARTEKRLAQLPEIDRAVSQKLAKIIGRERSLWEHPDQYEIYTDSEGVERIRQKSDIEPIEPEVTLPVKSSGPEVELQQEPEPDESELTGAQKLAAAKEITRGMIPSMNY
jgi:ParB-like chromosome segregation protein Spo0J